MRRSKSNWPRPAQDHRPSRPSRMRRPTSDRRTASRLLRATPREGIGAQPVSHKAAEALLRPVAYRAGRGSDLSLEGRREQHRSPWPSASRPRLGGTPLRPAPWGIDRRDELADRHEGEGEPRGERQRSEPVLGHRGDKHNRVSGRTQGESVERTRARSAKPRPTTSITARCTSQ